MAKAAHPKVKQAFADALEPLTEDEHARLEESIKTEGCRDAIKTWKGCVADGHNRLKICKAQGAGYNIQELSTEKFPTEDSVVLWIVTTQLARRNLVPVRYKYLIGKYINSIPSKTKGAKGKDGSHKNKDSGKGKEPDLEQQNLELDKEAAKQKTADSMGVTVSTVENIAKKSAETDKLAASLKKAYLSANLKLTTAELKALALLPKGTQLEKAKLIKAGKRESWSHALGLKAAGARKQGPQKAKGPKPVIGPQEVVDGFKRLSKLVDSFNNANPNEDKCEETQATLNIALETFFEWSGLE